MLSWVYFEIFYLELLDPEILSAVNSIPRLLKIECIGFDPILRFYTLLRHSYARMRTYYLPCVLSAVGSIRSSCDSALFCDTSMDVYVRTTYSASDLVILPCNPR